MARTPTRAELREAEERAQELSAARWQREQEEPVEAFTVRGGRGQGPLRVYGPSRWAEALLRGATEDLSLLSAEVRRLNEQVQRLEGEAARPRPGPPSRPAPPSGTDGAEAELGSLISAPFRVTARAAKAAKDDPLAALAVQVAKALSPEARDIERARLIAMAFAASTGDLDGFWAARRQRPKAAKKKS